MNNMENTKKRKHMDMHVDKETNTNMTKKGNKITKGGTA